MGEFSAIRTYHDGDVTFRTIDSRITFRSELYHIHGYTYKSDIKNIPTGYRLITPDEWRKFYYSFTDVWPKNPPLFYFKNKVWYYLNYIDGEGTALRAHESDWVVAVCLVKDIC